MSDLDRPILESYWVEPGRFLAGEYPAEYFGDSMQQRIPSFLDFGIDTFIDLTAPDELPPYLPMLEEQARYYKIDIRYKRYSITDHGVPQSEHMRSILDEIDASLAAGRKIYVHCWGGIGRTGTVVGCYLVRRGLSGREALAQLAEWWQGVPKSRFWPHSPETRRQMEFILGWDNESHSPRPSP